MSTTTTHIDSLRTEHHRDGSIYFFVPVSNDDTMLLATVGPADGKWIACCFHGPIDFDFSVWPSREDADRAADAHSQKTIEIFHEQPVA